MKFFAHRGGSVETFGNTASAVMRSLSMGLDVEVDVRACANSLVCTHYDKIGENPNSADSLKVFDVEDLRQFRLTRQGIVHDPFTVDGGIADRIPTLLEILSLVRGTGSTVLLDLKDADIAALVREQVERLAMDSQVIYGIHKLSELPDWQGVPNVLAFCGREELGAFCESSVAWIRLWQSWVRDSFGQLHNPDSLVRLVTKSGKQACVMTGAPNIARGGTCTLAEVRQLYELGFEAAILNDPSLCIEGKYAI